MNLSQKDLGNEFFKKQKYQQAISHYEKYLSQDHLDNHNALFNLSLCYSKVHNSQKSIEAAEKAIEINPQYTKCYYRLAHQYQKLNNQNYRVFINSSLFQKMADPIQQSKQIEQMTKISSQYICMLRKPLQKKQIHQNIQQIIQESAYFIQKRQDNVELDKAIDQWLVQWVQNTQSDQAKWIEIQDIITNQDYQYGKNLAHFYINQIQDPLLKSETLKKLIELQKSIKKQQQIVFQDLDINPKEEVPQTQNSSDSDQNLHYNPKDIILRADQIQISREPNQTKVDEVKVEKKVFTNPKKALEAKQFEKIQRQVEKQNESEFQLQNNQFKKVQSLIKAKKQITKVSSEQQKPSNIVSSLKQDSKTSQQTKKKKLNSSETQLEDIYNKVTAKLQQAKADKFTASYQCVVNILSLKNVQQADKEWLIVQLSKRIKKFKLIMEATSENQQKVIFDLLKSNNMEQYASHVAPKYKISS